MLRGTEGYTLEWWQGWGAQGAGTFHSAGQRKEGKLVLALPSIRFSWKFTCSVATSWKPRRVFMAMGRKAIPWSRQAWHVKFLMSELNHENLNGAVILWKFNINDILSHTLVSAYGFSLSRILPYFPLSLRASANKRDINGEICPSLLATEWNFCLWCFLQKTKYFPA